MRYYRIGGARRGGERCRWRERRVGKCEGGKRDMSEERGM